MSGFELIKNNPGLSTFIGLEFLLFLIVSYQIQVDEYKKSYKMLLVR